MRLRRGEDVLVPPGLLEPPLLLFEVLALEPFIISCCFVIIVIMGLFKPGGDEDDEEEDDDDEDGGGGVKEAGADTFSMRTHVAGDGLDRVVEVDGDRVLVMLWLLLVFVLLVVAVDSMRSRMMIGVLMPEWLIELFAVVDADEAGTDEDDDEEDEEDEEDEDDEIGEDKWLELLLLMLNVFVVDWFACWNDGVDKCGNVIIVRGLVGIWPVLWQTFDEFI